MGYHGSMSHTDRQELLGKLDDARAGVMIGALYRHSRTGGVYRVTDIAIREETGDVCIIYREENGDPAVSWDRPYTGDHGWSTPIRENGKETDRFVPE